MQAAQRGSSLKDSQWEGQGETNGEHHGSIHTNMRKTASQWEVALHLRGLKPGLCDNLEGWDAVGGGRQPQEGGSTRMIHADAWQKPAQ